MKTSRLIVPAALAAASALVLAGCATGADGAGGADAKISVVTSTNVYAQIVEEIGGDNVTVTPIISSSAQDPHSYEATARDQLTVSRADLIVENGGGYDSFVDTLIEATGTDAPVITGASFSHDWPDNDGHADEADDHAEDAADDHDHADDATDDDHDHDHSDHGHVEGFNEHVWYDPHTIVHLAEEIAHELTELDPANADAYTAGLATFAAGIDELEASLDQIAADYSGSKVFVTEPVPVYLTTAAGLENVTPDAFSEAVEEGQDVPPATLLEALTLLGSGEVRVVIANAQTGGAETSQVIAEAEKNEIPVLEFTETLPEGQTYLSWMQDNIAQLEEALTA